MKKPIKTLKKAQLIEGIGASSWFTITEEHNLYRIERFSEEGQLECSRLFKVEPNTFDIKLPYTFTYLSHCKQCTIIQNDQIFKFFTNEY